MTHALTEIVLGVAALVCLGLGVSITWAAIVDVRDPALQDPSVRVNSYDWTLGGVSLLAGALAAYCFVAGL